jgi:putative DNA primase/helicase
VSTVDGYHDLAYSELLAEEHADRLRFVRGVGWLHWDGRRWAPGDDQASRAAKDIAKDSLLRAVEDGDDKRTKAATGRCSEPRIRAALTLAETDARLTVSPDELDAHAHLLNAPNGVIDLRDGTIAPHDPALLLTKLTGAPYDPAACSARWRQFLTRATRGDLDFIAFLQRCAGYSAFASFDEEVLLFAHGPGASGKTTLLEALRGALGDYGRVADFSTFLAGRSDGDGPTPGVARLMGARLVTASETSAGQKFNPERLKKLTGGERISARQMYGSPFEFTPVFTLWLAANERPAIPSSDDAAWRRIRIVPFENTIPTSERDPDLKRALTSDPTEQAAILAWIVQGAVEWHHNGLGTCTAVENATAGYQAENDPIGAWLTACCTLDPSSTTTSKQLRGDYERYCSFSGDDPCSQRDFASALRSHGLRGKHTKHGTAWTGITVTPVTPVTPVTDQTGKFPHTRAHGGFATRGVTAVTAVTPHDGDRAR